MSIEDNRCLPMLDAHPNTVAPLESRFAIHYYQKYGKIKKWNKSTKLNFIEDVQKERKIELIWELDVQLMTARILNLPESSTYGLVCKQVYASVKSIFQKEQQQVIIDKNPIHGILIPLIYKIFPDAKIIHLVRDYRASANSTKELQIGKSMKNIGYHWLLSNSQIEMYKVNLFKESYTVTYESLLTDPTEELSKLCEFLNIPYNSVMIDYYKVTEKGIQDYIARSPNEFIKDIRSKGSALIHKNISRPIDVSLINKWQKNLSSEQIKALESICGEYGKKYGYKMIYESDGTSPKLSFATKFKGRKLNLYYRLPIWLRELKSKPKLVFLEE